MKQIAEILAPFVKDYVLKYFSADCKIYMFFSSYLETLFFCNE